MLQCVGIANRQTEGRVAVVHCLRLRVMRVLATSCLVHVRESSSCYISCHAESFLAPCQRESVQLLPRSMRTTHLLCRHREQSTHLSVSSCRPTEDAQPRTASDTALQIAPLRTSCTMQTCGISPRASASSQTHVKRQQLTWIECSEQVQRAASAVVSQSSTGSAFRIVVTCCVFRFWTRSSVCCSACSSCCSSSSVSAACGESTSNAATRVPK